MVQTPKLIIDLALILTVAGITTLIFRKIHQSAILGYIIAGFLVGPHVSLLPTVTDSEGLQSWSEIGVIFLLFTLGLEFSFKKLIKVGGSASVTALVGIILMIGLGFLIAQIMHWSIMDSIFLGAILSISSTMITVKAFDELGIRTKKFVSLVLGVLIIQDLVAVLLLVLLSTLSLSKQFAGWELLTQILKLAFFLVLWFLGGIFFVPTFIRRTRKLLNDETMLIVSLALCLAMVLLAVTVGFSAALGAFIMGSILAETSEAERIGHLVRPVKDLFAAVFFVSVGIMFDPLVLEDHLFMVIIIVLITVFGKLLSNLLGALLAGQSLKHAVQAGMSLAQIGEFSFIIAALGVSLNVTSGFLYPVAVATAVVTAFITPLMIKGSGDLYTFLTNALPTRWLKIINRYSITSQQLSAYSDWREMLRAYVINFVVHGVIIVAIIILSQRFFYPYLRNAFDDILPGKIITIIITLLLMVPFIWALAIRRIKKEAYTNLWLNKKLNRGPLVTIEVLRFVIAVFLVALLFDLYFSISIAFLIGVLSMALAIIIFSRKLQAFYDRIEKSFLINLHNRETEVPGKPEIAPWDAHLAEFVIVPEFPLIGKQLMELKLREQYGVNIALIERGKLAIMVPDRHERLYPGDQLSVIGTDDQLAKLKELFEQPAKEDAGSPSPNPAIALQNFTISRESMLCNQSIRASGIREAGKALVVGIERTGERFLNPESSMIILEGDIVWVVGDKEIMENFLAEKVRADTEN